MFMIITGNRACGVLKLPVDRNWTTFPRRRLHKYWELDPGHPPAARQLPMGLLRISYPETRVIGRLRRAGVTPRGSSLL